MNRIQLVCIAVLGFCITGNLLGQDYGWGVNHISSESSGVEEVVDWAWQGPFDPFIEMTTGLTQLQHDKFMSRLPEVNLVEVKLGYSQNQQYEKILWKSDQRFTFGTYMDQNISGITSPAAGKFRAKLVRFGFGNRSGYGYQLGQFKCLPFFQSGLGWTRLKSDTLHSLLSRNDADILNRYQGVFRFGMQTEGGIEIQLMNSLGIIGSYELAVIYPRHIFWPWLGSNIIMQGGMGLITAFADDIIQSSPLLGPLFYFVLKNGLAYLFYQGVKEKMNWPFNSETPMTIENLKLGLSVTF